MPPDWTCDVARMEARHASGLLVRFRPDKDGAWNGAPVGRIPQVVAILDANQAAGLMREAGEAMMAALVAHPKP